MLLCLQALQAEFGYVDPLAVPIVADVFNVSRADVHGVLTFYHDLRTTPPPRCSIRLCVAEACQARGSRALVDYVESELAMSLGQRTDDGIAVEAVYCVGNCALGPAALVDDRLVGRLTPDHFDELLATVRTAVNAR